jgi:hypothetical protein
MTFSSLLGVAKMSMDTSPYSGGGSAGAFMRFVRYVSERTKKSLELGSSY